MSTPANNPNPEPAAAPNNLPAGSAPVYNANRTNTLPTIRFGVTATVRATQHQIPSGRGNIGGPNVPTNNNAGEFPQPTQSLFQMRDRLFLALFFRVSLIYARAFPRNLRRVLEFCLLMQSILLLFILAYIHVVYTRTPITCLKEYKDSWPKTGVLRVEITSNYVDYDLAKSYSKEDRMRQRAAASQFGQYTDDLFSLMLTADSLILDRVVSTAGGLIATVTGANTAAASNPTEENIDPTSSVETEPPDSGSSTTVSTEASIVNSGDNPINAPMHLDDPNSDDGGQNKSIELEEDVQVAAAEGEQRNPELEVAPSIPITASGEGSVGIASGISDYESDPDSPYFNKTLEEIEMMKMQEKQAEENKLLNSSVTDYEMFTNSVWVQEQVYIVEYALEYGFLRLSGETRQKLNIPVKLVILDPTKEACFGDTLSLFLLENFLGYDDILMSSIKNLAESEEIKGYLRNVVTGEQFRFVPMWMARSSYIPALLIMLVFTVSISMLLRYSHHQIFVFIVDLLNNIEGAGSIHIPAAPLFTVILALVGMEAIMSEFFNDTSTAFYVILIVWIADQYDSVCSHTNITKTYWVRFFYLYHFAFYAYHYRFNGQYGGLALLVSWSFIQHSMVYFYHHYELPAILRQAHQPERNNSTTGPAPPTPPAGGGGAGDEAHTSPPHTQDPPPPPPSNNSSPESATRASPSNETAHMGEHDSAINPSSINQISNTGSAPPTPQPSSSSLGDDNSSVIPAEVGRSSRNSESVGSVGVNSNDCNPSPKSMSETRTKAHSSSESQSQCKDQGKGGGGLVSGDQAGSYHDEEDEGLRHRLPTQRQQQEQTVNGKGVGSEPLPSTSSSPSTTSTTPLTIRMEDLD